MALMEHFPKQRKYKYFTSQKVWSQKNKNRFSQKNTSHYKKYFTSKYFTSQQVFLHKTLDVTNKFLHRKTSQIVKHDYKIDYHENYMIKTRGLVVVSPQSSVVNQLQ